MPCGRGSTSPSAIADRSSTVHRDVTGRIPTTPVAGRYAAVTGDQRARRGRRSDGSEFTVESISRYHAHDMVHHAHDVGLDVTHGGAPGTGA